MAKKKTVKKEITSKWNLDLVSLEEITFLEREIFAAEKNDQIIDFDNDKRSSGAMIKKAVIKTGISTNKSAGMILLIRRV